MKVYFFIYIYKYSYIKKEDRSKYKIIGKDHQGHIIIIQKITTLEKVRIARKNQEISES